MKNLQQRDHVIIDIEHDHSILNSNEINHSNKTSIENTIFTKNLIDFNTQASSKISYYIAEMNNKVHISPNHCILDSSNPEIEPCIEPQKISDIGESVVSKEVLKYPLANIAKIKLRSRCSNYFKNRKTLKKLIEESMNTITDHLLKLKLMKNLKEPYWIAVQMFQY